MKTNTMTETLDLPEAVEFIDASSLAKCLAVSRATVLRWRRAGRLPRAAFASPQSTVWNVADILRWNASGRPTDVAASLDAGPETCEAADREAIADRQREIKPYEQDFGTDLSQLPEQLQSLIRESQRHILVCEAILNTCGMFTQQAADLNIQRSCPFYAQHTAAASG